VGWGGPPKKERGWSNTGGPPLWYRGAGRHHLAKTAKQGPQNLRQKTGPKDPWGKKRQDQTWRQTGQKNCVRAFAEGKERVKTLVLKPNSKLTKKTTTHLPAGPSKTPGIG